MPIKTAVKTQAFDIMSWLVAMTDPDVEEHLGTEATITHATKVGWLWDAYAPKCPLLAVDDRTSAGDALRCAGLIEGEFGPAVLRPRDKHQTVLTCHWRYRLTQLGRRWAVGVYSDLQPTAHELLGKMLVAAVDCPDAIGILRDRILTAKAVRSPCVGVKVSDEATWLALIALGAGCTAAAPWSDCAVVLASHSDVVSVQPVRR